MKPDTTLNRKTLSQYLERPVYRHLEEQSIHHTGLMDIAIRLADLAGDRLTMGQSNLINVTLAEALGRWGVTLVHQGVKAAYSAYCQVVFDALHHVLRFKVLGRSSSKQYPYAYLWDCTSQNWFCWVQENSIDPLSLTIQCDEQATPELRHSISYLLATRVFTRHDLNTLGMPSEHLSSTPDMETCP